MSLAALDTDHSHPAPSAWTGDDLRNPHAVADKGVRVRRMFDEIAATYERVNTLTSLGRDKHWRRRTVQLAAVTTADRVLDVACGTGDLARAFAAAGAARVIGADFAEDMLRRACHRSEDSNATRDGAPVSPTGWCLADAQKLAFADGSFTVVSCAFGVRNFQNLAAGLSEMSRVLAPGGRAVILEFSLPRSRIVRAGYRLYLEQVLPRVARMLSGERVGAYQYLARSVLSFVDERGLMDALRAAGFADVARHRLTFGIVNVYVARKASVSAGAFA